MQIHRMIRWNYTHPEISPEWIEGAALHNPLGEHTSNLQGINQSDRCKAKQAAKVRLTST